MSCGRETTIKSSTNGAQPGIFPLSDGQIQVRSDGQGSDLVLIHSLLTGPEAFDEISRSLATGHTVHRVYLPGFGGSTRLTASDPTIADLAGVVASTMSALGCAPDAAVLGNGLGAFVALALAIHHGDTFDRLILSNVGAAFPDGRKQAFVTMSELADTGGMEAVADIALARIFPASYLETHPAALEERRPVLLGIDPGAFADACRALAVLDLRDDIADVSNPTLVIAGDIDQTTPTDMARELAEGVPGARLVVLPDCGHCPQLEQPAALLTAIREHLAAGSHGA